MPCRSASSSKGEAPCRVDGRRSFASGSRPSSMTACCANPPSAESRSRAVSGTGWRRISVWKRSFSTSSSARTCRPWTLRPERRCAWLLDELEERLGATLGRQAESLEQIASDVRLVACLVDRAYVGLLDTIAFRDVRDVDSRRAQLNEYHGIWREAAGRLWRDGGLAFHLAASAEDQEEGERE